MIWRNMNMLELSRYKPNVFNENNRCNHNVHIRLQANYQKHNYKQH